MKQHAVSEIFDIPQFAYFEFGNPFTGSRGSLSFKITPRDQLTVQIWHSKLCSEKAEIEEQQEYPMNEEGFHALLRWLESKVDT